MPGPKPKPTKLKRLAGNPGHQMLNDNELDPPPGTPDMPRWISPEAKMEWGRIVPELEALGLLAKIDRAALIGYCQSYAELEITTKALDEQGREVLEPICCNGEVVGTKRKKHPLVSCQQVAFARLKSYLELFGMSPADRSRVNIPAGDEAGSAFDKLMERLRNATNEN